MTGSRGHRVLPHTADVRIEAWGPSLPECLAEAVTALVDSFADTSGAGATPRHVARIELRADTAEDALLALLDEVIYRLDTDGAVPLGVAVERLGDADAPDNGQDSGTDAEMRFRVRMPLVPVDTLDLAGAVPKAVSLNELSLRRDSGGRWSCTATIDV